MMLRDPEAIDPGSYYRTVEFLGTPMYGTSWPVAMERLVKL
jgi:hypothetical protein